MIEQAILAMCLNLQTPDLSKYYGACQHVLMAASIQTHVKPKFEAFQRGIEQVIAESTNEKVWMVVGFAYASYVKNQLTFNLNVKPIVDNLYITANTDAQMTTLSWSW